MISNQVNADYHQKENITIEGIDKNINISYSSNPKVGYLNLEILALDRKTSEPIQDIIVSVLAEHSEEKFLTYALSVPSDPFIYKCVFDLEASGSWQFTALFNENKIDEEKYKFEINLLDRNRETSPFSVSGYLFALIFLVLFLSPMIIFRKSIFTK